MKWRNVGIVFLLLAGMALCYNAFFSRQREAIPNADAQVGLRAKGVLGAPSATPAQIRRGPKLDLKLLYVGHTGSSREKDFVAFLSEHFTQVNTDELARFSAAAAEGFDVVLLDYDGDGFKAPQVTLPPQYAKPTVAIGVTGGMICVQRNLRTGYL